MIKLMEFIFQDFWHWSGTLMMIAVILSPLIAYGAAKGEKENEENK